jgi:hypothetical protein
MRTYSTTVTNHGGFKKPSMIKVTKDNFVWKLLSETQAELIFASGLFSIYRLYYDDTEALIETFDEIREAIEDELQIGIEVGYYECI